MSTINNLYHNWLSNYQTKLKEKYICMYEGHIWLAGFFNECKKISFRENLPFEQSLAALNYFKDAVIKTIESNLAKFNKHIE